MGDITLVAALLLLGSYLVCFGGASSGEGRAVVIRGPGGEPVTYDLSTDRKIDIDGLEGTTEIMIEEGCVRFVSSPCPHKLCLKRGRISRVGEWIACVPNGVVAIVTGDAGYDGITP